jgi:hypothetical protein
MIKKNILQQRKTLITGEYLVLMAPKLLLPTKKKGQNLIIEEGSNKEII